MILNDNSEHGLDSAEAPENSDLLAPDEAKFVQEGAATQSSERRQFLINSLGKGMSASTEILKDLVVSLYDDGKKIVGIDSGALKQVYLPSDRAGGSDMLSEHPAAQDLSEPTTAQELQGTDRSAEGAVGDRSKDSGLGKPTKPEVTTDLLGRLTEYRLPDGTKYEITYGLLLTPTTVGVTPEGGARTVYEKTWGGKWQDQADPDHTLNGVSFDGESKKVIINDYNETTLGPDGSYEKKVRLGWDHGKLNARIDADGTAHRYDHTADTETVIKPGSCIAQVNSADGSAVKGYELRDDQGHLTKIEVDASGGATVSKGDATPAFYEKLERTADGDLKLSSKGSSSLEIRKDGTAILRDAQDKIISVTNSDGETTTFDRNKHGKVVGLTVTDGQGYEVEQRTSGIEVDDATGSYKVTLSKAEAEARKADGAEDAAVKLERNADGTERLLAKDGTTEIKSDADKLLDKFKNYTDQQRFELKQDLADIDKLPAEQRAKVYDSLNKIARNDEHPEDKVKLNGQQARELVASVAHHIAHPESIEQGAHETCAAANVEQIAARNHPEVYADMVANLATQGEYTTSGGTVIYAEAHNGKLDGKSDVFRQRSYASELFQDAVVDLAVRLGSPTRRYRSLAPDSPDIHPRPAGVTPANDHGERLIDPSNPSAQPEEFPGLDCIKQLKALKELFPTESYGNRPINTPAELEQAFADNGHGPTKVAIDLAGETFTGMSEGAGTLSGEHAIVLTKIEDGLVYYENTAGGNNRSYPHGQGVPIQEFVNAMKSASKGAYVRGAWPAGAR